MHNYFTNYHTPPTCFDTIVSSSDSFAINTLPSYTSMSNAAVGRLRLKCDGTRPETRFRLSAKRTSPFKSAGASVQSTTGSRGVRISGSNAGYIMFRGSVRVLATHSIRQFPLHFPSRASPCAITFQLDSDTVYSFTKLKLLKTNAAIWFHKICKTNYKHMWSFKLYHQRLHLTYLRSLTRYGLRAPWG